MSVLFKIIKKNLKLLIRSKSSALIIILGPLLVIFLVGIAFGNISKYSLNLGVYSESYTELTNSFIEKLEDKEFRVQQIDTQELCIEQIKLGKLHTCIIFPPDLTVESDKINEIVFYVDYSKVNLIWMVLDTLSTKVQERSSELTLDLTTNLLNKIEKTREDINSNKPILENLETNNQQIIIDLDQFNQEISNKLPELSSTSNEIREYVLEKIKFAQEIIPEVTAKIDILSTNCSENVSSCISSSTKNSINQEINSINTFLYNIYSKIEDPNNLSEADWEKIARLVTEVDIALNQLTNSITSTVTDSSTKIDEIQTSLNTITNNLESIEIQNAATIVNPITTQIKTVVPEKSYLNFLFPPLIVLVVMFISILLSTTLVMMEKHSLAYFRNFITPTRDITFILATFLTNIFLVSIQLIIIVAISIKFFKAQILASLTTSIPAMLLITTFFSFIGMFIGYLFTSEETATLASISLGSVFLFLSDVILPLESMPDYIRNIAQFNPFVIGENLLRKSILFQAKFTALANDFYLLFYYSLILFVLIWIS
ncbi:ABC transporter permease, partial [Candidatus Woesearchaeota archaeon]|nr:ABC transporter permease [Candidatus Woesearchaeota archaeon]